MQVPAGKVDAILARLALMRRGIVTREELLGAGLSTGQIQTRLEEIEVVVVGRHRRSLEGVRVHSIERLASGELRWIDGLPVTSPSLSLLDIAADLSLDQLTGAVHEARVQRIVTDEHLRSTLQAHPNRRGARHLGALLRMEGSAKMTRSTAERLALRQMREQGLDPESDVPLGAYRVDFFFRAEKLIVEVDGFRFHSTPSRFAADRRRAAALTATGYVVFPLSWSDLTGGAEAIRRLVMALEERRRQLDIAV